MKRKVTIFDVAKEAGVSVSSVSAVLNGRDHVSNATASRIRSIMDVVGFVPRAHSGRTRNLKTKRPVSKALMKLRGGQILFLVPDSNPAASKTFLMQHVAMGAAQCFSEFEMDMLIGHLMGAQSVPAILSNRQVKGVILRSWAQPHRGERWTDAQIKAFKRVPCVEFFSINPGPHWDGVVVDDLAIGRMALDYLVSKQCRKLVVLNASQGDPAFHLRIQSFCFEACSAGLVPEVREVHAGDTLSHGFPSVTSNHERVGVFIAGYTSERNPPDRVARDLWQAGLTLQNNVHVIGCCQTNVGHARVYVTMERIGRYCAEQLVWRMQHPDAEVRRIMVHPKVIEPSPAGSVIPPQSMMSLADPFKPTIKSSYRPENWPARRGD